MMKISAHIEGVTVSTWLGYAKHSKGPQSMPGAQHAWGSLSSSHGHGERFLTPPNSTRTADLP